MCAVICLSLNKYHYTQVHTIRTKMHHIQHRQAEDTKAIEIHYTKEKDEEKRNGVKTKKIR